MDHPLGFLVGTWTGTGTGEYPTTEPFAYREVLEIGVSPKGFLTHAQRTADAVTAAPMHAEVGYWRSPAPGHVELVLAHPSGVVEICEGSLEGQSLHLRSTTVAGTRSAKVVDTLERWYRVEGDVLHHRLSMGAVGIDHQHHLVAELRRTSG